jgi:hypothetical protein
MPPPMFPYTAPSEPRRQLTPSFGETRSKSFVCFFTAAFGSKKVR